MLIYIKTLKNIWVSLLLRLVQYLLDINNFTIHLVRKSVQAECNYKHIKIHYIRVLVLEQYKHLHYNYWTHQVHKLLNTVLEHMVHNKKIVGII